MSPTFPMGEPLLYAVAMDMNSRQYLDAIAHLGLSQVAAGHLFGVNPRTSRRWAAGDQPIPKAVALALRLMVKHKVSVNTAEKLLSHPP